MEETVGQFAKRVGTTVRTLRYYDSIRLLQPAKRNTRGQKIYTHEEWEKYQQILVCKHLGMSLEETKNLLGDLRVSPQAMLQLQKHLLEQKRNEIDEVLKTIERTERIYQVEENQTEEIDDFLFVMLDAFRREQSQIKVLKEYMSKDFYEAFLGDYEDPTVQKKADLEVARFYKGMKVALKRGLDASSTEVQRMVKDLISLIPSDALATEIIKQGDSFIIDHQALFAMPFPQELDGYIQSAISIYYKAEGIDLNGS